MSAIGDFISFQYGSYHSSDLGIVHISDGDRYNEDLTPQLSDKTLQRPGSDGTYFFGSFYTQKQFTLSFAFDNVTELQYRNIGRCFNTKKPVWFWTDERPYKKYLVKASAAVQMKTICFDERDENDVPERHYKGEGSVTLITYEPYARSRYRYLSNFYAHLLLGEDCYEARTLTGTRTERVQGSRYYERRYYFEASEGGEPYTPSLFEPTIKYDNIDEWSAAANMLWSSVVGTTKYDVFVTNTGLTNATARVYNGGDIETECAIRLKFTNGILLPINPKLGRTYWIYVNNVKTPVTAGTLYDFSTAYYDSETSETQLAVTEMSFQSGEAHIFIEQDDVIYGQIKLTLPIVAKDNDIYIEINSKYNLIRGLEDINVPSAYIYDEYKKSGDFFKLNTDESVITATGIYLNTTNPDIPQIDYDFLYY